MSIKNATAGLTHDLFVPVDPYVTLDPTIVGVSLTAICLTTIFMIIRASSLWDIKKFERDDWFLTAAYVVNLASILLALTQDVQGLLDTNWAKLSPILVAITQEGFALELLYCLTIILAKTAVLFQLSRVFAPSRKGAVYLACNTLIGVNLVCYVGSAAAVLLQCIPLVALWDPFVHGQCTNRSLILILTGAINIFSDIIIFLLPVWVLSRMNSGLKYRPDVVAVFSTAGLVMATSIGRLVFSIFLLYGSDPTLLIARVELWTIFETALLIICPSFLFVPRFIRILRGQSRAALEDDKALPKKPRIQHHVTV